MNDTNSAEDSTSTANNSGLLELTFDREADRYSNRLVVRQGDRVIAVMQSVEGTAEDIWPPSPPLQEVTREDRTDHSVFLGVGQAGSSHWSSSFKVSENNRKIEIEHACRINKQQSPALFITYRVLDDWDIQKQADQKVQLYHRSSGHSILLKAKNFVMNERVIKIAAEISPSLNNSSPKATATILWGLEIEVC